MVGRGVIGLRLRCCPCRSSLAEGACHPELVSEFEPLAPAVAGCTLGAAPILSVADAWCPETPAGAP